MQHLRQGHARGADSDAQLHQEAESNPAGAQQHLRARVAVNVSLHRELPTAAMNLRR